MSGMPSAALVLALLLQTGMACAQRSFDHSHRAWNELLGRHVVTAPGGHATAVRYRALAAERSRLGAYLAELSGVTEAQFRDWDAARQLAFLINAYNAFTVEKILTRYPQLGSIRDFGRVFGNPWKDAFFSLLGQRMHLDRLEHEIVRARGAYDEPRVHYALNCAAIGCPALREEAYVAGRLDAQLEAQARRFLADRSRNRFNARSGRLEVSRIFDWYKEDWTSGFRGMGSAGEPVRSREEYFARYADLLADTPEHRALVAAQRAPLAFLDYDWTLNDAR